MIRFFRKIRENLISEGKIANYLKYAIGEIVLVVIGILIALQINNWNEGQKLETIKQTYLKQLIVDIEHQEQYIQDQITFLEDNIRLYDAYVEEFNTSNWNYTEILGRLGNLNSLTQTLVLSNNTLETLKQTGEIKLIPVALRNELIKLERLVRYIEHLEERHVALYIESINKATTKGFSPVVTRYLNRPDVIDQFDDQKQLELLLIAEDTFHWKWSNEKVRLGILNDILKQSQLTRELIQLEID